MCHESCQQLEAHRSTCLAAWLGDNPNAVRGQAFDPPWGTAPTCRCRRGPGICSTPWGKPSSELPMLHISRHSCGSGGSRGRHGAAGRPFASCMRSARRRAGARPSWGASCSLILGIQTAYAHDIISEHMVSWEALTASQGAKGSAAPCLAACCLPGPEARGADSPR